MPNLSTPKLPKPTLVHPDYCRQWGLDGETSTASLSVADRDRYSHYCEWRRNWRRLRCDRLPMDVRLTAYLWLVGEQGGWFHLGRSPIPSEKWLRKMLGIHRHALGRYIRDAKTKGRVQPKLAAVSQLAFAAAIYPPVSRHEREAEQEVLCSRLDLIHDYHLTGRDQANMASDLIPIVRSGENNLSTHSRNYPRLCLI
ncbi:hypothetical protein CA85_40670 [Allorhodopirellula solitaria]|uniref:Uncharacterized protein n=1 Tax=Allorhodopirellula solitaria TaxID=2527987 RepID=A0A5C5X059_9BACT|nr:hypothetical protein CA85_40670 [Allorhodopirellula solitaria]